MLLPMAEGHIVTVALPMGLQVDGKGGEPQGDVERKPVRESLAIPTHPMNEQHARVLRGVTTLPATQVAGSAGQGHQNVSWITMGEIAMARTKEIGAHAPPAYE